ncbi:hypothetical protein [Nostoc sp.]
MNQKPNIFGLWVKSGLSLDIALTLPEAITPILDLPGERKQVID